MPAFVKSPKFISGAIIVLSLVYVIWANLRLAVQIHLFPGIAILSLSLPGVIIVSALFGAAVALVIQLLWKRRSSKKASVSAAAP